MFEGIFLFIVFYGVYWYDCFFDLFFGDITRDRILGWVDDRYDLV